MAKAVTYCFVISARVLCPLMMYLPVFNLFMPMAPFSFSSAPLVLSKAQELGKPQRFIWEKKKMGGGRGKTAQQQLNPRNSHVYPNSSEPSGDSDFLG